MVNPTLTGYNTKDEVTLQELQEKSPISVERKRNLWEIEKKETKELKSFRKLLE